MHVVLSAAERDTFKRLLMTNADNVLQSVLSVDARRAQVSKAEDRDYILSRVAEVGGLEGITSAMRGAMRAWCLQAAVAAVVEEERQHAGGHLLVRFNAAVFLFQAGAFELAEPLLRRELNDCTAAHGDLHERTLGALGQLASTINMQGRHAEAEPLLRQALERYTEVLGEEHACTLAALGNLASCLTNQGKLAEAELLERRALQLKEKVFGPTHPETSAAASNLANTLCNQGKDMEALPLYRRAVHDWTASLGAEHPNTIGATKSLGYTLLDLGGDHVEEGVSTLHTALKGAVAYHGASSQFVKEIAGVLCGALRGLGREDEAARVEADLARMARVR